MIKKSFLVFLPQTSPQQAKISIITHNAGEITVEIIETKHNIETLCDRLNRLRDSL
ncbi:hypothetical protein [Microcoleus sp. bin38.metabat.b11b12b14.051]|uniref:hypothetical protein n=1 Tax=Microcoleus sp. bin38.metabat.b11b12b14.051 TaxID=2742709 RepID=UPI0025D95725|nr:hypothetical protein [Microcoleus sp. bin38.metabat.b11b12b14.051]